MDTSFSTLAPLIALATAAGINLYATGLTAGLLGHFQLITLPAGLGWLENPWVIGILGVMFVLEFFADKIRFVDTVWDFIHTFIRPAGALALGLGLTRDLPEWSIPLVMLLSGGTALATHSAKASFSLGLKSTPPVGFNTTRSILEDVLAVGLTWLAMTHPMLALSVVLIMFLLFLLIAPRLFALGSFWLASPFHSLKAAFTAAPLAPLRRYAGHLIRHFGADLPALINLRFIAPILIVRGHHLGLWRRGHLALDDNHFFIVRSGFFAHKVLTLKRAELLHVKFESGWLYDRLELNTPGGRIFLLVQATHGAALEQTLRELATLHGASQVWELPNESSEAGAGGAIAAPSEGVEI